MVKPGRIENEDRSSGVGAGRGPQGKGATGEGGLEKVTLKEGLKEVRSRS